MDRRLDLMKSHLCVDVGAEDILLPLGTISVIRCACGVPLYGGAAAHLLHVYDVIADDALTASEASCHPPSPTRAATINPIWLY
jgi:hypothetical protein